MQCTFSLPQNIDRSRRILAMNGNQFCLVNVIAHILHHLKDRLLRDISDFGYRGLKASDFNWVITVPAFWKSDGGNMMLEAGHMVSPTFQTVLANWSSSLATTKTRVVTLVADKRRGSEVY